MESKNYLSGETGSFLEDEMGHSDFIEELSSLELSVEFKDTRPIWNYEVFGLDISDAPSKEIYVLTRGINAIANDFNTGSKTTFDTSQ